MARGVRFTQSERAAIKFAIEYTVLHTAFSAKEKKAAQSALDKLELSEMPVKKGTYLTVQDAIGAFREVLGKRLLAPGFQAVGVLAQMKNRITALGLTRADCLSAARAAGQQWQGVIRAESIVRQADKLLAEGVDTETFTVGRTPQTKSNSPIELGDEEI